MTKTLLAGEMLMCIPARFVITASDVIWSPAHNSHNQILDEYSLNQQDSCEAVCAELIPPENNYTKPLEQWRFVVGEEDALPWWFNCDDTEKRCRLQLPNWRKAHVVMPDENVKSLKGYKTAVYGNIEYTDGATIKYIRAGRIEFVHNSIIENFSAGIIDHLCDGTIKSFTGGTINFMWDGTIGAINGGEIKYIRGGVINYFAGSLPRKVFGDPTIINYGTLDRKILYSGKAVIIDRSSQRIICHIGSREGLQDISQQTA